MAMTPPRHCHSGHPPFTGRNCPLCHAKRKAEAETRRPTAPQRGYTGKWAKARAAFLAKPENRFCACGCGRVADVVDHIVAHKGDPALFWDRSNWQPMAKGCNSRKGIRSEGAFGRPVASKGHANDR